MNSYIPKLLAIFVLLPSIQAAKDWVSIVQQDNTNIFLLFELTVMVGLVIFILIVIIGVLAFQNYRLREQVYQPMYKPIISDPSPSLIGLNAHGRLHDALNKLFSIEELNEMIFELGIGEEWAAETKSELVTKLVMWMWRRDRLEELYSMVERKRPSVKLWG